ncbi:GNAT domain [Dillenia turbinata]|uniref:GNAT domain n=1 Tax=Dillenia turbinata TaxID=194707 RepID=A0AAN8VAL7_9MAGN
MKVTVLSVPAVDMITGMIGPGLGRVRIEQDFGSEELQGKTGLELGIGFPRRDPDKIRLALENTDTMLWVEFEKTKTPVAFARATGDGVFNAIIWDVVVDPSFQGIGLGKAVMERLVTEPLRKGITNIALYS